MAPQDELPPSEARLIVQGVHVARRHTRPQLGNPGGITLRVDGKNPLPPGTVEPITLRLRRHGKVAG